MKSLEPHKNYTFKVQIAFHRLNARLKLNYCVLPDPPHFSLLSTTEIGLTMGRFLNFLGSPMIVKCKKYIYCG